MHNVMREFMDLSLLCVQVRMLFLVCTVRNKVCREHSEMSLFVSRFNYCLLAMS